MSCWQNEMVIMLRHFLNDLDSPPRYSDVRLEELVLVSAKFMRFDVKLKHDYDVDVDAGSISPDPIKEEDYAFVSLVCLKAACILTRADARTSAGQSIGIKDGRSAIDLKGVFQGKIAMAQNFCEAYENAKFEYTLGNLVVGRAILAPFTSEDILIGFKRGQSRH